MMMSCGVDAVSGSGLRQQICFLGKIKKTQASLRMTSRLCFVSGSLMIIILFYCQSLLLFFFLKRKAVLPTYTYLDALELLLSHMALVAFPPPCKVSVEKENKRLSAYIPCARSQRIF